MINNISNIHNNKSKYFTTPIYYVNDIPHIGHGYSSIIADVLSRFYQMIGDNTYFITGTDEHGEKVLKSAFNKKISTELYIKENRQHFRDMSKQLNINENLFIYTSHELHIKTVLHVWNILKDKNLIYIGTYSGWYSTIEETFFKEKDLIDNKTPMGNTVEWEEEQCYFFKLSFFQNILLDFYKKNPNFVMPQHRFNEIIQFVSSGLDDICISRKGINNGIPVPEEINNEDFHSIYVWFDALINYLTVLGFGTEAWQKKKEYWDEVVHIIGKDIITFHGVLWPAILLGIGITPPKQLLVHGWWTIEGEKMSKSKKNVISPKDLSERYDSDYIRYFLLKEMSVGHDGNFSEESIKKRINGELINNLGNLVNRFTSLLTMFNGGIIENGICMIETENIINTLKIHIENYEFVKYLDFLMNLSSQGNLLLEKYKPWKILSCKENISMEEKNILRDLFFSIGKILHIVGTFLYPFTPKLSLRILKSMSVNKIDINFDITGMIVETPLSPIVTKLE
jgi:methionyl-tRNA synthetase